MCNLRRSVTLLAVLFAGAASAQIKSANPMNHVGEQHNAYLACLQKVNADGKSNPLEALVDQCGFKPEQPADEFIQEYTELMPENLLAPLSETLAPHRKAFNDKQYYFALEIERVLSTQSPEQASKSLADLENKAVQSLGRETADLAVLSGVSTARHSLLFWTQSPPARIKWWHVVLADVAGGVVGGVVGGVAGAVGLGTACSNAVAQLD
ncbi:hypothetical protein [Melittangium boletus]|uniref:Uncharacterized protein n=1 Tax=Melittangium boletus DSM 14713 TaxID=1294270 RepID=A0A250IFN1_9BACT|nr:hypothetical protein [Melittangium boletus]ATB29736.1 hypothetical protein MEBOL_003191 [Melittangium boletus DSM 14713]